VPVEDALFLVRRRDAEVVLPAPLDEHPDQASAHRGLPLDDVEPVHAREGADAELLAGEDLRDRLRRIPRVAEVTTLVEDAADLPDLLEGERVRIEGAEFERHL